MMPRVWSERGELHDTSWNDCTYSSGLMALIYGGFTKFPLGIYTDVEREALERSDDQADEVGANQDDLTTAVRRRYGLTLHRPSSTETIRVLLSRPGTALTVAGSFGNLSPANSLRRWSPSFVGGHCVCVVVDDAGLIHWLDPLASMGFVGDLTSAANVAAYAYGGPSNIRYVRKDEYITPAPTGETMKTYGVPPVPQVVDVPVGTKLYVDDTLATVFKTIGTVRVMPLIGYPAPGVRQVQYVDEKGVASGQCYFAKAADVGHGRDLPIGDTADLQRRLTAALAAVTAAEGRAKTSEAALAEWIALRAAARKLLGVA